MTSKPGRSDNAAWRKAKAQALRDAGGQCQLCGEGLDPAAPMGTPWATEIDHIISLAFGGSAYGRENLRAVHRWCHQRRDSGLPPDTMRPSVPAPGVWPDGCPESHKGQDCYTTGPTGPHSRNW